MAGFLSDLFSKKKQVPKLDQLEAQLRVLSGVSDEVVERFATQLVKQDVGDFSFDCMKARDFDNFERAQKAYRTLRPYLKDKHFTSFKLENVRSSQEMLLREPNFTTDALVFNDCSFMQQDFDLFVTGLPLTNAQSLTFNECDCSSFERLVLQNALTAMPQLKTLVFNRADLYDLSFSELAPALKQSSLETLDLSGNYARGNGLADLFNALPNTLKTLKISDTPIHQDELSALVDRLPSLKRLEHLDLSSGYVTDANLLSLLPVLPKSLQVFNIKRANINDKSFEPLVRHLQKPDVLIHTTNAQDRLFSNAVDLDLLDQLQTAEKTNKKKSLHVLQDQKAQEIAQIKEERTFLSSIDQAMTQEEIKPFMHKAIELGAGAKAFDKMVEVKGIFGLSDLMQTNTAGKTVIEECSRHGLLGKLMTPKLYINAKEYQNIFTSLSPKDQACFDGKAGRPSFLKMKNQVMAIAVKQNILKNKVQR